VASGLPIEQIGPDIHRHVARVLSTCFGVPLDAALERWCDAVMSEPDRTTYAAFDGWTIVAVSSMVVRDGTAVLAGAATLPEWRGRGLHREMVARRREDAARLGVATVDGGRPDAQ
jgi:hypothetical protein